MRALVAKPRWLLGVVRSDHRPGVVSNLQAGHLSPQTPSTNAHPCFGHFIFLGWETGAICEPDSIMSFSPFSFLESILVGYFDIIIVRIFCQLPLDKK